MSRIIVTSSFLLLIILFTACGSGREDDAMATAVQQTVAARDALATQQVAQAIVETATSSPTVTSTSTPVPPTATATAVPPTATASPPPPTAIVIPPTNTYAPPPPRPELNTFLDPHYGSRSLSTGFLPDPYTVSMTSGGSVNVSYLNSGYGCTGYAAAAPDFRLFWSGDGDELSFTFVANASSADTTLIINDPRGNWYCNDDFDGVNPGIHFHTAASGQYDIWVGSYSAYDNIDGQLSITELGIPSQAPPTPIAELNPSLEPNYGSKSLSSGFWPDPEEVSLTSGGSVDVSYLNNGIGCTGYATAAPDFRLFWSGGLDELSFMFIANSSSDDTTLIINDPYGNWHCNDDFTGVNPGIRFDTAVSGQYDIWIGSYSVNDNISGRLQITELGIP